MSISPIPWQTLLSERFGNISDQYGPNSHAVGAALMTLADTPWLRHVGEPWLESAAEPQSQLTIVKSWEDALFIFDDFPRYNINGVLQAACDPCDRVVDGDPAREAWWQRAREDAKQYTSLMGWIPRTLSQEHRELMYEYLYEYISMLLAEIIAAPEANSTYFREQLTWFRAGHFSCGWDGDWPYGRLKIF